MPDPTCPRCQHAKAHGWWGPPRGLAHCRKCHRDWRGTAQAHCVTCCQHFSTYSAADLHLTRTGCRPPDQVLTKIGAPSLMLDHDKHGAIWRWAGTRPASRMRRGATSYSRVSEVPATGVAGAT
jgi:hypothetical protein